MARRQRKAGNTVISADARAAFRQLRAAEDSDAWWKAHSDLHDALKLPPWKWPAVKPPDVSWGWHASADALAEAEALWDALEAARR